MENPTDAKIMQLNLWTKNPPGYTTVVQSSELKISCSWSIHHKNSLEEYEQKPEIDELKPNEVIPVKDQNTLIEQSPL